MSEMFEIAYAAATNRLCLFTGTGFSKAVSAGKAPTWQGLLEELCNFLPNHETLKKSLFPKDKLHLLSLEESAQIISIKMLAQDKNIHAETAKIISDIHISDDNKEVKHFFPIVLFESSLQTMIN